MGLGWIFYVVPPIEPCALRSTQPLKVSTRDFSWGKGSQCIWLTTYHPCSAETLRKSGALIYLEPLGPPRPVAGHLYSTSLAGRAIAGYRHQLYIQTRVRLKRDGTRADTTFRLSPKRTSPFKSAGGVSSFNCWQPRCAHQR